MTEQGTKLFEQTSEEGVRRWLVVFPAWDKGQKYGVHGMDWYFGVARNKCAVEWRLMMPFHLKSVRERWGRRPGWDFDGLGSISYHSPVALYEEQNCSEHSCEWTGGDCYGDGSALHSEEFFDKVVAEPEMLWKGLEERLFSIEQRVREQQELARNFS